MDEGQPAFHASLKQNHPSFEPSSVARVRLQSHVGDDTVSEGGEDARCLALARKRGEVRVRATDGTSNEATMDDVGQPTFPAHKVRLL